MRNFRAGSVDLHISDVAELVALLPVLTSLISDGCM